MTLKQLKHVIMASVRKDACLTIKDVQVDALVQAADTAEMDSAAQARQHHLVHLIAVAECVLRLTRK